MYDVLKCIVQQPYTAAVAFAAGERNSVVCAVNAAVGKYSNKVTIQRRYRLRESEWQGFYVI